MRFVEAAGSAFGKRKRLDFDDAFED